MIKRSFPPVTDTRTRLLVLGSLPGDRSLAAARYYAHPQNQFWRLMSAVIDRDLVALPYDERLAALLERRIGLWDVVASAVRPGSGDAAIRDLVGNDLTGLIATLPDLRAIAFNGATSYRHGVRQLGRTDLARTDLARTDLATIALPSSSPLHTVGVEAKLPAWLGMRVFL